MAATTSTVRVNRAWYVVVPMFTQVVLGVLYTWSVFRGPLAKLHGWSEAQTIAPYRYSLLALAAGTVLAGMWLDRKGPRFVETISGLLLGTGMLLAAAFSNSPGGLIFSYGILGGLGVGFGYVAPIATCIRWFPDKRGFIAGLAVVGSGVGPVFYGPFLQGLIGRDASRFEESIPRTFLILAGIFYVSVIGAAQFYRLPPAGWKPEGWTPPAAKQVAVEERSPRGMLATWQFYGLYALYFLGASVGLTAIGMAAPLLDAVSGTGAAISAGLALGVMSLFNGGGRLSWGAVSDRLGRKRAAIFMSVVSIVTCLALLRPAQGFWPVLTGLCLAAFAYGGWLALMPSLAADYYGPRHVGANYGLLFSAWGLCGFVAPGYFASVLDRSRAAGGTMGGYGEVFTELAGVSAVALILAAVLRKPAARTVN
jgi:OFA family oxalate/formate antiporter-like MFS transporter